MIMLAWIFSAFLGVAAENTSSPEDPFDQLIASTPHSQRLDNHKDSLALGGWMAFNNLWGKGTAVPGRDFRSVILINEKTFPHGTLIAWDMPARASQFGGASVWNYSQLFFGNRHDLRRDLPGFPVRLDQLKELVLDFRISTVPGDRLFKIAINIFFTDTEELAPLTKNRGDFFVVLQQVGDWMPPYPERLPDITIEGKSFSVPYKKDESTGYENRRVIIQSGKELHAGRIDLLKLFAMFREQGMLQFEQSMASVMIGVEVTKGFGAVRFEKIDLHVKRKP